MQELKLKLSNKTEELTGRKVTIFIQWASFQLIGNLRWDMHADEVFCSDVMLTMPLEFIGTKGIIHPDDMAQVKEAVSLPGMIGHLAFRIITTYGEVKLISGDNIRVERDNSSLPSLMPFLTQGLEDRQWKSAYQKLKLAGAIYQRTERFTGTGIWYHNIASSTTWYSDQVFRIHDLQPQSLNVHLNTFNPFIHPEDRDQVIEFREKAFRQRTPLHIEYRLMTAAGEKYVQYTTHWFFTEEGEEVIGGTYQDISQQKKGEEAAELSEQTIRFQKQLLLFDEQHASLGHWQISLITRKMSCSDNVYRFFGLKPQSIPAGINRFINYVHPDDREAMLAAHKKMLYEHEVPEIDFRVIRGDGKIRYISQKARLVNHGEEMYVTGTMQDVTVQRVLEKKLEELTENTAISSFAYRQSEEMAGVGSWVWDTDANQITWSDNFYRLLGYKPQSVEMSHKLLKVFIHPDDQKYFSDQLNIILEKKEDTEFSFRLIQKGVERRVKGSFRRLAYENKNLVIAIMQEVTREYELEQQLHDRVQLAESLSENILDRVIITDSDNMIQVWNGQCVSIYGIPKEEAVGRNFFDVFPKLKTEEELQLFNRVLRGETILLRGMNSHLDRGYYDLHMLPLWSEKNKEEITGIIHIIHDVTREVELRQSLSERLVFIESLVESSVDRIIALDRNMNYLVWNRKCEEYYGLPKEKVIGKNVLEIFPDTRNTPTYEEFRKVLRGETIYIPPQKDAAKENYHEIHLIPVKGGRNEILAILWILHDMSKDYELGMQQTRTNEIINALNEGFVEVDEDFRFRYVNKRTEEFWNKSLSEMRGRHILEVFPQVEGTELFQALVQAVREKINVRNEFLSPISGRWIYASISPAAEGVVIVYFDIQDIKKAQEGIREREYLLRNINEATPDAITIYDLRNKKPLYLNSILADWVGCTVEELAGMGFEQRLDLLHPDDRPLLVEANERILTIPDDEVITTEYRLQLKDGAMHWVRNRSKVFKRDEQGRVTHILSLIQDVNQQKTSEAKILKNNNLLEAVFNASLTGIAVLESVRQEGRIVDFTYQYANPVTEKIAGSDSSAHGFRGLFPHLNHPEIFEAFKQVVETGDPIDLEHYYQSEDRRSWLRITAVKLDDGLVASMEDISYRKRAEEKLVDTLNALEIRNQVYVYAEKIASLGTWTWDPVRDEITCSDNLFALLGIEGPLPGGLERKIADGGSGNNAGAELREKLGLKKGREPKDKEYRITLPNNRERILRNKCSLLNQANNRRTFIGTTQDITEEVQLRNLLTESSRYAETILDASVDRIAVFDRQLRFVAWNKRCAESSCIPREAAIGRTIADLFPRAAADPEYEAAHARSLAGYYVHIPYKKDVYSNQYFELFYIPLKNEAGETYAVVNIMHDVSNMIRNEETIIEFNRTLEKKNAELEQKNEEITSFAFIASHDLKEPLRKIQTFSDWLLEKELDHLSPLGQNYIRKISNSVDRLGQLIEDILLLTKVHSDTKKKEEVDLDSVLEKVQEDMSDLITRTQAHIVTEGSLQKIYGIENQIFFLFKNLLGNAIKFQKPGNLPEVLIRAEAVEASEINATSGKDYLKLSFTDNGFGFDKKYERKIFQVFQRLHGRQEFEGTGIGLAICKKIMDNHDGMITVDSRLGKGSTFNCYFPL